jgi:hypothetical protein
MIAILWIGSRGFKIRGIQGAYQGLIANRHLLNASMSITPITTSKVLKSMWAIIPM